MGGWDNQNSQLQRIIGSQITGIGDFYSTPNLLDCNQFVDLWVSWKHARRIQAGTGSFLLPTSLIIDTELPDELHVMAYSIANGWDDSGYWKIDEDIGI